MGSNDFLHLKAQKKASPISSPVVEGVTEELEVHFSIIRGGTLLDYHIQLLASAFECFYL